MAEYNHSAQALDILSHEEAEPILRALLRAGERGDSTPTRVVLRSYAWRHVAAAFDAENSPMTQPIHDVLSELSRATCKFPTWPTDPLHALAVLGEEFGELTKDMLQLTYEPHKTSPAKVRTEALQTAAMALRLYMSLDRYEYRPSTQHVQQRKGE